MECILQNFRIIHNHALEVHEKKWRKRLKDNKYKRTNKDKRQQGHKAAWAIYIKNIYIYQQGHRAARITDDKDKGQSGQRATQE
jgi:hypothetical protein